MEGEYLFQSLRQKARFPICCNSTGVPSLPSSPTTLCAARFCDRGGGHDGEMGPPVATLIKLRNVQSSTTVRLERVHRGEHIPGASLEGGITSSLQWLSAAAPCTKLEPERSRLVLAGALRLEGLWS